MSIKTQADLVSIIEQADADLGDNLNAHGFDWQATAKILTDAKRELAARFGKAVGYEGLYDLPPEACK